MPSLKRMKSDTPGSTPMRLNFLASMMLRLPPLAGWNHNAEVLVRRRQSATAQCICSSEIKAQPSQPLVFEAIEGLCTNPWLESQGCVWVYRFYLSGRAVDKQGRIINDAILGHGGIPWIEFDRGVASRSERSATSPSSAGTAERIERRCRPWGNRQGCTARSAPAGRWRSGLPGMAPLATSQTLRLLRVPSDSLE